MIITPHIKENAFGYTINYKLYRPNVTSKNYLIFLHGLGERGPIDGSKLDLVGKHGFTEHAQKGFQFPFNIIAPQAVSSHHAIRKFFPAYVKLKYNADVIIVTGLSMGGYGTFDTKTYDDFGLIYAIAPVCGGGNVTAMKKWPETNAWVFHGENDDRVKYRSSKGPVDAYNATHEKKIEYTLFEGMGHNIWDRVYSVKPGEDELLQQVNKWFAEAPKPTVDIEGVRSKMMQCVMSL